MSTRSYIAMQQEGRIQAIYCHYDGYPKHNGKVLVEHYQDPEKVKALIALGDLSSLDTEIGEQFDAQSYYRECKLSEMPKQTIAYHRDYKEELRISSYSSEITFFYGMQKSGAEYAYLYKDGQWYYADLCRTGEVFVPLVF